MQLFNNIYCKGAVLGLVLCTIGSDAAHQSRNASPPPSYAELYPERVNNTGRDASIHQNTHGRNNNTATGMAYFSDINSERRRYSANRHQSSSGQSRESGPKPRGRNDQLHHRNDASRRESSYERRYDPHDVTPNSQHKSSRLRERSHASHTHRPASAHRAHSSHSSRTNDNRPSRTMDINIWYPASSSHGIIADSRRLMNHHIRTATELLPKKGRKYLFPSSKSSHNMPSIQYPSQPTNPTKPKGSSSRHGLIHGSHSHGLLSKFRHSTWV